MEGSSFYHKWIPIFNNRSKIFTLTFALILQGYTLVLIALILFELQIPMHAKPRMANVLSSACRRDKISVSVSALQDMSVKMRPTVQVSTPYTHDQRNVIFWFDVLFSWIGTLLCAL